MAGALAGGCDAPCFEVHAVALGVVEDASAGGEDTTCFDARPAGLAGAAAGSD